MSRPPGPTVGVLALQGDVREHVRALEQSGARAVLVRRPGELDTVDGLVLPGGESTTMAKLATAFELMEPLRKRIGGGMPTYGSCAGMILLADRILDGVIGQETIGGIDMTVRRNAFGRQVDSFEEEVRVTGVAGAPFHAVFIRAPWVEEVGPDVEVLGVGGVPPTGGSGPNPDILPHRAGVGDLERNPDGGRPAPVTGRIVAVRHGHLLATSFHPELTGDPRIHALFVGIVRELA